MVGQAKCLPVGHLGRLPSQQAIDLGQARTVHVEVSVELDSFGHEIDNLSRDGEQPSAFGAESVRAIPVGAHSSQLLGPNVLRKGLFAAVVCQRNVALGEDGADGWSTLGSFMAASLSACSRSFLAISSRRSLFTT